MGEAQVMNWNDDRLDRLADDVGAVRAQVEVLQRHMDERFEKQEARIQGRFVTQEKTIDDRFDRLQTSLVIVLAGILAGIVLPGVF
jgi:predicted phage tail protein